jgi:hypothetical protein
MTEATAFEARTIHRLLEVYPKTFSEQERSNDQSVAGISARQEPRWAASAGAAYSLKLQGMSKLWLPRGTSEVGRHPKPFTIAEVDLEGIDQGMSS